MPPSSAGSGLLLLGATYKGELPATASCPVINMGRTLAWSAMHQHDMRWSNALLVGPFLLVVGIAS